jgi:hypothetical protein
MIVARNPDWRPLLLPIMLTGAIAGAIGLIAARRGESSRAADSWGNVAAGVGLAGILVAPACWSMAPVLARGNPVMPAADP